MPTFWGPCYDCTLQQKCALPRRNPNPEHVNKAISVVKATAFYFNHTMARWIIHWHVSHLTIRNWAEITWNIFGVYYQIKVERISYLPYNYQPIFTNCQFLFHTDMIKLSFPSATVAFPDRAVIQLFSQTSNSEGIAKSHTLKPRIPWEICVWTSNV
jgi:hypothetical protein